MMSDIETLSDHRLMTWAYQGRPGTRLPRNVHRRWRQRDLVWDEFLHDLRTVDLYSFETPDEGVEHLMSILVRLCQKHKKCTPAVLKGACWWTGQLSSQRSRLRALRRVYQRTLEQPQREKLDALYKRKRAEYRKAILHTKRASFRRFISEGLVTDNLGCAVEVVRGKWRRQAPASLILPSGEQVSTWEESQDELARHHFLQADEASQIAHNRAGEPDWFTIEELELAVKSLPLNKAPGHDGISLDTGASSRPYARCPIA